jgi:phosphoribosylaminoimidazole carboxylase (NCAIR synthetase)
VHLHDYGKKPRPGRKVGHCTVVEPSAARRDAHTLKLLKDLAADAGFP